MQHDKKDRASYMLTKFSNYFYHRKLKLIINVNKMNKVMKLFPLHKQPIDLKTQCWDLLQKCFYVTPEMLVLMILELFFLLK